MAATRSSMWIGCTSCGASPMRTVNGIEYFVYSAVGSAIGLDALGG